MRRGRPRRDPLALGLIGFAVLGAIIYVSFTKRVPFTEGYRVDAIVQSANQLRRGSPVRIAGVDVGKVIAVKDGPGDTSALTMEIAEGGRPIHRDATLRIRPRLFLEGGFYVELSPGSPTAEAMPRGGTIPLSQTSVPVQFHQVLSAFDRPTRDSLQGLLRETSIALDAGGAQALGRLNRPLAPALRDGAVVAAAARGTRSGDLAALITSASRVTGTLAGVDRELGGLIGNLNRTTRALASRDTHLRVSLRRLDGVLRATPRTLAAIDRTLPSVERFSRDVRPSLRRLPGDLEQASDVLDEARALVQPTELPALIDPLQPALRGLPQLANRLRRVMRLALPVSDCLRQRAVPMLLTELDDGSLSSGRPVWQDLAHMFVGLASMAQNFDANGPAARFLIGGGDVTFNTEIPGVGGLAGRASEPLLGARPLWLGPGERPPFRPNQPCAEQRPPDLQARTDSSVSFNQGPAPPFPSRARSGAVDHEALEDLLERLDTEGELDELLEALPPGRGKGKGKRGKRGNSDKPGEPRRKDDR